MWRARKRQENLDMSETDVSYACKVKMSTYVIIRNLCHRNKLKGPGNTLPGHFRGQECPLSDNKCRMAQEQMQSPVYSAHYSLKSF